MVIKSLPEIGSKHLYLRLVDEEPRKTQLMTRGSSLDLPRAVW